MVYVDYGERGPTVIHARLVLHATQSTEYMILTPDYDMYSEDYSEANVDLTSYWAALPGRAPPPAVDPTTFYGFAPMTAMQLSGFLAAGQIAATNEINARGLAARAGAALRW